MEKETVKKKVFESSEPFNPDILARALNPGLFGKHIIFRDTIGSTNVFLKKLAQEGGLLVGVSSGAVMHVALEYEKKLSKDNVIVVILADSGRSYLSKVFTDQKSIPLTDEK